MNTNPSSEPGAIHYTVDYVLSGLTAASGNDFEGRSGTLTFAAGETTKTIYTNVYNDTLYEGAEAFQIALSNATGGATIAVAQGIITINDPGDLPTVAISNSTAFESGELIFEVKRTGDLSIGYSVGYSTSNGTADAGTDYVAKIGTLEFAPNQSVAYINVATLNDGVIETGDETLSVTLSDPSLGTISAGTATGTVKDVGVTTTLSIADGSAVIEGGSATFTIHRGGDVSAGSAVTWTVRNGSATVGADLAAQTGTVTFAAGETSKNIIVTTINDQSYELDETFFVDLSNATVGNSIVRGTAVGTILADPADMLPTVNLVGDLSVSEGEGFANFTLVRTGDTGAMTSVAYTIVAGTATAGSDFVLQNGIAHFGAGDVNAVVSIKLQDDLAFEGNETFSVTLHDPVDGLLGNITSAIATIVDNDTPPVLTASDVVVDEAAGVAVITLTLNKAAAIAGTVNISTVANTASSGDDFTSHVTAVTFAPGEISKVIEIPIVDDAIGEGTETFSLSISDAVGLSIATPSVQVTIADNDAAATIGTTGNVVVNEADGTVTFNVIRNGNADSTSTVEYSLADGTADAGLDFAAAAGTLTFAAGERSKSVMVTIQDDVIFEGNETFDLVLRNAQNASITTATTTATIADNDAEPKLSVSVASESEAAGQLQFIVSMTTASTSAISVDYATIAGTATAGLDFATTTGSVTFAPGETRKIVNVPIVNDSERELTETLSLQISNVTGGLATIVKDSANASIIDDESSPIISVADVFVNEADGTVTFTVTRSGNLSSPSSVDFVTKGVSTELDPHCPPVDDSGLAIEGDDFTVLSGNLSFLSGEATKTVTVSIVEDALDEVDEQFTLSLANAQNAQVQTYNAAAHIIDNDGVERFSVADVRVSEGAGVATVTVMRAGDASLATTISYATGIADTDAATDGSDYVATSGLLSFAAGVRSQTFTIEITDDSTNFEIVENIKVTISNPSSGIIIDAEAAAQIVDNDVAYVDVQTDFMDGQSGSAFFNPGGSGLHSGRSVGDVNGDGYDDVYFTQLNTEVGSPWLDPSNYGQVVFGSADGLLNPYSVEARDGSGGFMISRFDEEIGYGDVNNDGFSDMISRDRIILGRADWTGTIANDGYAEGNLTFEDSSGDFLRIESIGDFNGDGLSDLVFIRDGSSVDILFGTDAGWDAITNLDDFVFDGTDGFSVLSNNYYQPFWNEAGVTTAGDVNGDGINDLVLFGRQHMDFNNNGIQPDISSGQLTVIYGAANIGSSGSYTIQNLSGNDGTMFMTTAENLGYHGGIVGDVNGDGFQDILVTTNSRVPDYSYAYLIYGTDAGWDGTVNLTTLDYNASNVQKLRFPELQWGARTNANYGDINGDGFSDLVFTDSKIAYVIYGSSEGVLGGVDQIDVTQGGLTGANGFIQDTGGSAVVNKGVAILDLNGDGFADLVNGTYRFDATTNAANGLFVYQEGGAFTSSVTLTGTQGADTLNGSILADVIVAGAGDDYVCGKGGADVVRGAAGNDVVVIGDNTFLSVDGGGGSDTLVFGQSGIILDLEMKSQGALMSIEIIDMGDSSGALRISDLEVISLSETSNTLTVKGGFSDTLTLHSAASAWTASGSTVTLEDGQLYKEYSFGSAKMIVDADVNVVIETGTTLAGSVVAGPVISTLSVTLYDEAGTMLAQTTTKPNGTFSVNNLKYSGNMLVVVEDTNGTAGDYTDEFTGESVDLSVPLRAVVNYTGNKTDLSVTPMTELAVRLMGVTTTAAPTGTIADGVNTALAATFGVTDLLGHVEAINGGNFASASDAAQNYGMMLAGLSAMDGLYGSMEIALDRITDGLTVVTNMSGDVTSITMSSELLAVSDVVDAGLNAYVAQDDIADGPAAAGMAMVAAGVVFGTDGADALSGTAGADLIAAGAGNDTITHSAGDDMIFGGDGIDTITLAGQSGITFDFSKVSSVETVNLTGTGDNTLSLSLEDLVASAPSGAELHVLGNTGDSVNLSADTGTWQDTGVNDGSFSAWALAGSTVWLHDDLTVSTVY